MSWEKYYINEWKWVDFSEAVTVLFMVSFGINALWFISFLVKKCKRELSALLCCKIEHSQENLEKFINFKISELNSKLLLNSKFNSTDNTSSTVNEK